MMIAMFTKILALLFALLLGSCSNFTKSTAMPSSPTPLELEIEAACPDGMEIPEPFRQLFRWIETKGTVIVDDGEFIEENKGKHSGTLSIVEDLWEGQRGTHVYFSSKYDPWNPAWAKAVNAAEFDRLFVFIRTGGDGSYAGLWRNDDGDLKVVHLGSGSGSTMACVIAESPVDFLRLLAIGYSELSMIDSQSNDPPSEHGDIPPHTEFQAWVRETFGVTIPKTASEIVGELAFYGDENPDDEFLQWLEGVNP